MKSESKAPPDLRDRLLAAALAPAAFNISVLILSLVFLKGRGTLIDVLPSALGTSLAILFVVVPAAVGFAVGTDGFVRFLGHSFFTHGEDERKVGVTLAIWAALIAAAWLLSRVAPT